MRHFGYTASYDCLTTSQSYYAADDDNVWSSLAESKEKKYVQRVSSK